MSVQNARRVIHHTLGNGDFGVFERMYSEVTAAHAMLSADNATA
jgi:TPP-dependent 2-oxoacid decarboxylase